MFNSYVTNYQRVTEMGVYFMENPYENGFGGTTPFFPKPPNESKGFL